MKISILEVEGSAEEIESSPAVTAALARLGVGQPVVRATDVDGPRSPGLGAALGTTIAGVADEGQVSVQGLMSRNPAPNQFRAFMQETTSWPNAAAFGVKRKGQGPKEPLDYTRYLRLRKQGSSVGGFVYTWPESGRINFRLCFDTDAALRKIAPSAWRTATGHREYRVMLDLGDDNLHEALALARRAYDLT